MLCLIISDERVSNLEGLACNRYIHQNVLTNKGQGYKADLVIECTGLRPNNNFTRKVFGKTPKTAHIVQEISI